MFLLFFLSDGSDFFLWFFSFVLWRLWSCSVFSDGDCGDGRLCLQIGVLVMLWDSGVMLCFGGLDGVLVDDVECCNCCRFELL